MNTKFKRLIEKYSPLFFVLAGLTSLLMPILLPFFLWHFKPVVLENIYRWYTELPHFFFLDAQEGSYFLSPKTILFVRNLYLERIFVETLVRLYNTLAACVLLTLLAGFLHCIILKFFKRNRLTMLGIPLFFLSFAFVCFLYGIPNPFLCSFLIAFVIFVNHYSTHTSQVCFQKTFVPFISLVFFLCLPYFSHFLLPVPFLLFVASCLYPGSQKWRSVATFIGLTVVYTISIPLVTQGFLSLKKIPLSSQAQQIISAKNLYDLEIDSKTKNIFVTTKNTGRGYILRPDLVGLPKSFYLPTNEFLEITINSEEREIYHINRGVNDIMVIDPDTLQIKRHKLLSGDCNGSISTDYVQSANRLFVVCEDDNLIVVNLESLETEAQIPIGEGVDLLADQENEIVYFTYVYESIVDALDARDLSLKKRVPGPRLSFLMAHSKTRNELFVPATLESEIWVYSTPDLTLKRKIPTQFGVRAIALDTENNLILAASLVTGYVDVIGLDTGETIGHYFVGKYGRRIIVLPGSRKALITLAKKGLFSLEY